MNATTLDPAPTTEAPRARGTAIRFLQKYAIYGVLLLLVILATVAYPGFLGWNSIKLLLTQNAPLGIVAVGMTLVIITGGFDLSVGAVYAAAGTVSAVLALQGNVGLGIVAGIAAGAVAGLINAVVVTRFHVNPFIATLGTSTIFAGLVLIATRSQSFPVNDPGFFVLGQSVLAGVPLPLMFLVLTFVLGWLALSRSIFGRRLLSVGGNREASRLAGIRTGGVLAGAYVISGTLAAFAGVISASQLGVGQGSDGGGLLALQAIAIVVIGGTSLLGGEGSVVRTAVGLLIVATMNNLFFSLALDSNWQAVAQGIIIIAAVGLDQLARRRAR